MFRKNIYISDENVLNHLEKQSNMSAYVTELIKQDMNREKVKTKEDVIKIIEEYLDGRNLTVENKADNKEILNSIDEILNLEG